MGPMGVTAASLGEMYLLAIFVEMSDPARILSFQVYMTDFSQGDLIHMGLFTP